MSIEMWKWKSLSCVQLFLTPWTVVHGMLQARILGWVAVPFSRGSSQPGDQTQVSHTAGGFFTIANNQCCWGYGEKQTLRHWRWECHLMHPLWKIVWRFLKKLKIELPFDPAVPLTGIYAETILTWKDIYIPIFMLSLLFSHQVESNSSLPHGWQHARPPCPSLSSRVCPSSHPVNPTISSSVALFSICLQFFPASGSLPVNRLFASGGQSIGASASASVLPISIKSWCS